MRPLPSTCQGAGLLQSSYLPGDIAVIHPLANSDEVQEFLVSINWDKMADEPLTVKERLGGSSHDRPYPLSCWVMYPRSKSSDFTFEYIYTQNAFYLLPWFQCCAKENVFSVSSRLHFWWLRKRRLEEFLSKDGTVSRLLSHLSSIFNVLRMNYTIIVTAWNGR